MDYYSSYQRYTFAAVAQAVVMLVQAHYMRKGLRVTAAAADAAKKSADAATDAIAHAKSSTGKTDRAVVVVYSIAINTEKLEEYTVITFTLKNLGERLQVKWS